MISSWISFRSMSTAWIGLALCGAVCCDAAGLVSPRHLFAQGGTAKTTGKTAREGAAATVWRDYNSKNFLLHTDLPKDDAHDLLRRLETMLPLIAKYWGKPNQQTIEMFVVNDLDAWPRDTFPARAWQSLSTGGGVTLGQTLENTATGQPVAAKAVVYALSTHNTPMHEAVHAYCMLNFGETGPVWYAEGMAEMGTYWREKDPSVNVRPEVLKYLKSEQPKSLTEIVNPNQTTGDSWQNYAWRWALCHLLANNPNYAPRFRPLGLSLLNRRNGTFEDVYGSMAKEILFEYELFLNDFDNGYRADLCGWDWKAKFLSPTRSNLATAKVEAQRGWQASHVDCKADKPLAVSATGKWRLEKGGAECGPDGDGGGRGTLLGVMFNDYQLSEPFDVPLAESWTPPSDGRLFLRCNEPWGALSDNTGSVVVKFRAAEK